MDYRKFTKRELIDMLKEGRGKMFENLIPLEVVFDVMEFFAQNKSVKEIGSVFFNKIREIVNMDYFYLYCCTKKKIIYDWSLEYPQIDHNLNEVLAEYLGYERRIDHIYNDKDEESLIVPDKILDMLPPVSMVLPVYDAKLVKYILWFEDQDDSKIMNEKNFPFLKTLRNLIGMRMLEKEHSIGEEFFSEKYMDIPIAMEYYNAEGKLKLVNRRFIEMFGILDTNYIKGHDFFADKKISEEKKEKLKKGEILNYKTTFIIRSTFLARVSLNPERYAFNLDIRMQKMFDGYVSLIHDETDTYEKLEEKKIVIDKLIFLLDSIDGLVLTIDYDRKITNVYGCWKAKNKVDVDKLIGAELDKCYLFEDVLEFRNKIENSFKGKDQNIHYNLINFGDLSIFLTQLKSYEGLIIGALCVVHDITEYANKAREFKYEADVLREKFRTKGMVHAEPFSAILTKSTKMFAIFQYMDAISGSKQPVLITGESGVGKELIAHAVHKLNSTQGRFITANTYGMDDIKVLDTIFGHVEGAYTGAKDARDGLLKKASDGTLYINEIADLSLDVQEKLLYVLEANEYYPLGSERAKRCTTRIICSTKKDLKLLMKKNKFSKDLYYRLLSHMISVPPLRDRKEDIPLLVDNFIEKSCHILGKEKPVPPLELFTLLANYDFPGNVRELETMVFNAVAEHRTGKLSLEPFRKFIKENPEEFNKFKSEEKDQEFSLLFSDKIPTMDEAMDMLVEKALEAADGNQGVAADILGVSRQTINRRIKSIEDRNKK